jgi:deoxycytidylate deaminase
MVSTPSQTYPELVFGLVGAVGIDFDPVIKALRNSLGEIGYGQTQVIRLSKLLELFDVWDGNSPAADLPEDERISRYMTAGNKLREKAERGDALIGPAVEDIWRFRSSQGKQIEGTLPEGVDNCAYILRSLKHPDEVRRLQTLYGPGFILIGVNLAEEQLATILEQKITATSKQPAQNARRRAEELIKRDSYEPETDLGQNVRDTFAMADLFVDSSDEPRLISSIQRFVELMFSHPNHTPTRDEAGMYQAYSAALLSSSLSRQVGASITTYDGQVISFGTNEVPKPGGGFYWEGTPQIDDDRDFRRGVDSNQAIQNEILGELIAKLKEVGWLKEGVPADIYDIRKKLKGVRLLDVTEFHRAVHGEAAALLDAARKGHSVQDCTLYCTTFPCHNCAGLIIAAGIKRVVYIEPYPKSKARDFYNKAFSSDPKSEGRVHITPFVGVGPRRYRDVFSMMTSEGKKIERMDDRGQAIHPDKRKKMLKWGTLYTSQFDNEDGFLENLNTKIDPLRSEKKGEVK